MKLGKLGSFCLFIALQAALVSSQSQHCYFCNTEIHGQACAEPINKEQVQIQRCHDSEIVIPEDTRTYLSTVRDFFKQHTSLTHENRNVQDRTSNPTVCIFMNYEFNHRNVWSRGCETQTRLGSLGSIEICTYYRQLTANLDRITNFNCSTCTNDLCTHANDFQISDGGKGFQVSVKMILGLLLARFLFI